MQKQIFKILFYSAIFLMLPFSAKAAILFQDDFDYSDAFSNHGWGEVSSESVIGAGLGQGGSNALQINFGADQINRQHNYNVPASTKEVWVKFDFRADCGSGSCVGGAKFLKMFGIRSGSNYANSTFQLVYQTSQFAGVMYGSNGDTRDADTLLPYADDPIFPNDNQWHTFKVHMKYNDNGQSNGAYDVWYDGENQISVSNINNRSNNNSQYLDYIQLGGWNQNYGNVPYSIIYDNFVVASSDPDPNITSATAQTTFSDGTIVDITGSGFGTKSPVAPTVWADFSSNINPSTLGQKSSWDGIDSGTHAFSSSVPSGAGTTKGAQFTLDSSCSAGNSFCAYGFMTTVPSATKLYTYWKRYFDFNGSNFWNNLKTWRFTNSDFTSDFLASYGNSGMSYNEGDTSNPDRYFSPWTPPIQQWMTEEFFWQKTGGTGQFKDASPATGSGIFNYDRNGVQMQHMESVNNGSADYVNLYTDNYFAEARPDNGSHIYMKDIYIDDTPARVIIGNASTLSASTHREIQIPQTTWNDGQVQIKVNQGSLPNGAAYLYVIDSTNAANASGFQINFGSGGDVTPPSAPSGLSVL